MTMTFRTLKANLEEILVAAAAGRYQVVGYEIQGTGAGEVLGSNRRVQIFYESGDFPLGKAGRQGPTQHEITFRIGLTLSATSKGDLATIDSGAATPAQKAAALAAFQDAAGEADTAMDEFLDIIYQILMDKNNEDIGTAGPPFIVSSRWVSGMIKDIPLSQGEFVVLTGSLSYTCQAIETIVGVAGTPVGTEPFNQTTDLVGDDIEKTGASV